MKLDKKKKLAVEVLNVGKDRIIFDKNRLEEIKEAITKQDIRDLFKDGSIRIREKKGRKKVIKRKRRKIGKIKKKIVKRKQEYVKLVRKLRRYALELKKQGKINQSEYFNLRKMIKSKAFRNKANMREYIKK